jgi:hypothetical protein
MIKQQSMKSKSRRGPKPRPARGAALAVVDLSVEISLELLD